MLALVQLIKEMSDLRLVYECDFHPVASSSKFLHLPAHDGAKDHSFVCMLMIGHQSYERSINKIKKKQSPLFKPVKPSHK
jgi:hypothetical protein